MDVSLDLFVDVTGQQLLVSGAALIGADAVRLAERASLPVRVWLLDRPEADGDPLVPSALPDGYTQIIVAGRTDTDFTSGSGLLFSVTDFAEAGTGEELHYEGTLNLNTAALLAALAGRGTLQVVLDVLIEDDAATARVPLVMRHPAIAYRAVYSGTEPEPESGDDIYPVPSALALRTVAGGYRIKEDGSFQLWNPTQNLFHTLTLSGAAGEETLSIEAGEA